MDIRLINECNLLIDRVLSLPGDFLTYYPGANSSQLNSFEESIKNKLPVDFRYFLSKINGFSIYADLVYPIGPMEEEEDLLQIFTREHDLVINPMPLHYLPFSPNGRGDHYCFDLSMKDDEFETCPVMFWQHDYSPFHPNDIDKTHDNFISWLEELLDEL